MKTKTIRQAAAMRNPMAAVLSHGTHQPRAVAAKKGKGSFRRVDKHRAQAYA
jgi:stalled ribosome alternative rescue factor ArfA